MRYAAHASPKSLLEGLPMYCRQFIAETFDAIVGRREMALAKFTSKVRSPSPLTTQQIRGNGSLTYVAICSAGLKTLSQDLSNFISSTMNQVLDEACRRKSPLRRAQTRFTHLIEHGDHVVKNPHVSICSTLRSILKRHKICCHHAGKGIGSASGVV